jgi:hypothetical protein
MFIVIFPRQQWLGERAPCRIYTYIILYIYCFV